MTVRSVRRRSNPPEQFPKRPLLTVPMRIMPGIFKRVLGQNPHVGTLYLELLMVAFGNVENFGHDPDTKKLNFLNSALGALNFKGLRYRDDAERLLELAVIMDLRWSGFRSLWIEKAQPDGVEKRMAIVSLNDTSSYLTDSEAFALVALVALDKYLISKNVRYFELATCLGLQSLRRQKFAARRDLAAQTESLIERRLADERATLQQRIHEMQAKKMERIRLLGADTQKNRKQRVSDFAKSLAERRKYEFSNAKQCATAIRDDVHKFARSIGHNFSGRVKTIAAELMDIEFGKPSPTS